VTVVDLKGSAGGARQYMNASSGEIASVGKQPKEARYFAGSGVKTGPAARAVEGKGGLGTVKSGAAERRAVAEKAEVTAAIEELAAAVAVAVKLEVAVVVWTLTVRVTLEAGAVLEGVFGPAVK